jgi:hypothetical protein
MADAVKNGSRTARRPCTALPLFDSIPHIKGRTGRPRHRPRQLFADRGYDFDKYRRLLRKRGIKPVIARRGMPHGSGLGTVRWVVERTKCATRRSVCIPGSAGRNSEGGSWAG